MLKTVRDPAALAGLSLGGAIMLSKRIVAISIAGLAAAFMGGVAAPAAGAQTADYSTFEHYLTADQVQQFQALTPAQQSEMVSIFTDPTVFYAPSSEASQLQAKYPGLQLSEPSYTPTSSDAPLGVRHAATSAATQYSVHSWYHHTVSFLWLSNTASLDYYYTTGSGRVLSDNRCTWHDSGFNTNSINNITVDHNVDSSGGHCHADVQFSELPYGVFSDYLDQDMDVNYKGVYHTHFYETN